MEFLAKALPAKYIVIHENDWEIHVTVDAAIESFKSD